MKEYIRVNRDSYDILYEEYNRRANARSIKKSDYEESAESLGGPILSRAKLQFKSISVLEIGPGSGEMSSFFDKNGCGTMAVELSPKMAEIAKNRSPNTLFILGDILETEFCENQFEIIYAGAVIHLFPLNDAIELLKKIYNWLKPNGFLFINTTIHAVSAEGYEIKPDYGTKIKRFRRKWKEMEFLTALIDSNFKILDRMFTNEKDRGKEWVAYICVKENKT
jgi:SAM-dependent methyltransferase